MAIIIWIAIAIGVIIALILIFKTTTSSRYEALTFTRHCKRCGYTTNGLKCPRCENMSER